MKTYRELRDFLDSLPDEDLDSPITLADDHDPEPAILSAGDINPDIYDDEVLSLLDVPLEDDEPTPRFVLKITWR